LNLHDVPVALVGAAEGAAECGNKP
jgi:hypothetical protein